MEKYEINLNLAVSKVLTIQSTSEDEAIGEVYRQLEEKGIERASILELKCTLLKGSIDSKSPSNTTN